MRALRLCGLRLLIAPPTLGSSDRRLAALEDGFGIDLRGTLRRQRVAWWAWQLGDGAARGLELRSLFRYWVGVLALLLDEAEVVADHAGLT